MNIGHEKLQCSDDGIIAGVCRGLADYLSLDVGVLRFAFVALAFVSLGIFALAYVVLWLVLPTSDGRYRTVEVQLDSAREEKPAAVQAEPKQRKSRAERASEPPTPPPAPGMEEVGESGGFTGFVAIGIVVGIAVVVSAFCIMLSILFPILSPMKLWPLAVIAPGIVRMVIPGSEGYRIEAFCEGALLILAGNVLLLNTTGMIVTNVDAWFSQGWPLLVIALGCTVLWKATGLDGFCAVAMVLIAAFCAVGVFFCSIYGPASYLLGASPVSGELVVFGV